MGSYKVTESINVDKDGEILVLNGVLWRNPVRLTPTDTAVSETTPATGLEAEVMAKVAEVLKANPQASSTDLTGLLTSALAFVPGASAVQPFISAIVGLAGGGKDLLGDALGALTGAKEDAPKSKQAELDAAIDRIKAGLNQ